MSRPGFDSPAAFTLRGVGQQKAGRTVLEDVTLEVPKAQVTVLLGPSGAGKSSLLRLFNRLDDPATGTVYRDGHPLAAYDVRLLRRTTGFLFQTPVMFPGTVRDNLETAAEIADVPADDAARRSASVLDLVGLPADLATRNSQELSVGQQQRASLARVLMTEPDVLLLDEPTAAIDAVAADHLLRTIRRLADERGVTVIMATHRLDEARRVADFVVVLNEGRVVRVGPNTGILDSPEHEAMRQLLETSGGTA